MARAVIWKRQIRTTTWARWKAKFKAWLLGQENGNAKSNGRFRSNDIYQRFYFRGQGDPKWKLEPTFDRRSKLRKSKTRNELEIELVDRFVEQAQRIEKLEYDANDVVGRRAVAQHYGLPTRLLDWSASPYIAAFFAFSDRLKNNEYSGDVAIWALDRTTREGMEIASNECLFLKPTDHANIRMGNQQGAFTLLNTDDPDLRRYLTRHDAEQLLTLFMIPAHQTVEALDDLVLMGIHPASLFPDRAGAAAHVDMLSQLDELREGHIEPDGRINVRMVAASKSA